MKAKLPMVVTKDKDLSLLQTQWQTSLNPLLTNPSNNGITLQNVSLVSGTNEIAHKLGRKLQGWQIVRMRGVFRQIFDEQETERMPELFLKLNSNGAVVVDIYVF